MKAIDRKVWTKAQAMARETTKAARTALRTGFRGVKDQNIYDFATGWWCAQPRLKVMYAGHYTLVEFRAFVLGAVRDIEFEDANKPERKA